MHGLPKPLVSIANEPLLQRQLLALKQYGIQSVTVLVNHKAHMIADFLAKHDNFGLDVQLVDDGEPRGTTGATLAALSTLPKDAQDILVIYGDTLFNVDFQRLFSFHTVHNGAATLFLHPNDHPADSAL